MSFEWRDWCRLCASSGASGINIFENTDFVWPDRIIKYLSISVNDEDELPQKVCQPCCQRITSFDHYAEQCLRVQTMFRAMSVQVDENNEKVDLIRSQFLQENIPEKQDGKFVVDSKKNVELLAIDADPFIPSDSSGPILKKSRKLKTTRKKIPRSKISIKIRTKPVVSKIKIEDPERRSSRLQVLAQTQLDFGIDSSSDVKMEPESFVEMETLLEPAPRKRGRPPKRLVGAAKRKAKKPRVVKPKKFSVSDEDFDDLGMIIKSDGDKVSQPSIFRWECHICGEMARNWNSLSIHTRQAHEVPAQVLCLCAKVLSSRASIIKHRLKHTNGYKYKCEKCDKSFHRRGCYELHVLSHVPKEEQPFVCCKCARRFHCEALLRQHEKVHLPREERLIYPCTTCQKKFSSKSAVSAHIKSIHFGERPFVCDQCGHSFTSKGILQEHLTIHSDETPFKCQHCHKSFKTKYRLKIHLDIHRETPYQCPVCPLQLSTRRTLRMHLVVHKDTKAFQCSTCSKAFRRAKDLKNHHNLHTGRRPYTCTFCPRTFANGSNCRSHKRRMHPEELRAYEAALAAAEQLAINPTGAPTQPSHVPPTPTTAAPAPAPTVPTPPTPGQQVTNVLNPQPPQNPLQMQPEQQQHQQQQQFQQRPPVFTDQADSHMPGGSYQPSEPVSRAPRNNTHHYVMPNNTMANNNDCSVNRPLVNNNVRRMDGNTISSHIPSMTPLNLNISELHSTRHQMGGLGMPDSDRRLENFHNQRSQMHNLNQDHIPNLTSNLHQLRQHQNFGMNRGMNDRINNLNRPGRDIGELGRSVGERDLGNNLNQMHHNASADQPNILQGYASSLNHLYQHPSSVAAAMAHSSTVGVPAFPGNPYVHHGMGSSLANYQRGNGNM